MLNPVLEMLGLLVGEIYFSVDLESGDVNDVLQRVAEGLLVISQNRFRRWRFASRWRASLHLREHEPGASPIRP